jgi:HlyD family secretion protein
MSTYIFRQVALERLSSPDQLDEALRVTSPRIWLALSGLTMLLGITCVWGYEGSISTTVDGKGVVVRSGGVSNVVSHGSGMLMNLNVHVGDKLHQGQVVALVAQPELLEQIKSAKQVLEEAKLERDRQLAVKTKNAGAAVAALERKRDLYERQIRVLREQVKLAASQVAAAEQLNAKGLVTRQQVLTADEKRVALEGQIENAQAELKQLDYQELSEQQQPNQAAAEMQARIADAERRLSGLATDLQINGKVLSPYSGEVVELKVDVGSTVAAGTPLLSVQPVADTLELLLYLPALQAKQVKASMPIEVSPTTVRREESGYMLGTATYVSDYPSTEAALMRHFQNEVLVQSLIHDGPVTEVRAVLQPDAQTPSGYRWSSSKGPAIRITSGTIFQGRIVTRSQRPVDLIVPYLKTKAGLD